MTGLEPAAIASIIGGIGAGAGAAAALSGGDSKVPEIEAPVPPSDLPVAPTQAKAPGTDKTQAEFATQRARDEERRRAASRQGRSNTILTGSLGVQAPAPTARKTLLGE
jgi:hypothetical protein